jgi:hypothetical protein
MAHPNRPVGGFTELGSYQGTGFSRAVRNQEWTGLVIVYLKRGGNNYSPESEGG